MSRSKDSLKICGKHQSARSECYNNANHMAEGRIHEARSHRPFRRDRTIVIALLAILQGGLFFYIATVVSTAREWRMRSALERHANTARLCARLLDEQCDNAVDVLRSLARQPVLGNALSSKKQEVIRREQYLREAVQLVPDLMATALYDTKGKRIARYPGTAPFPLQAQEQAWFHGVKASDKPYVGNVIRLSDQERTSVFTIAVPVESTGKTGNTSGKYLLAFYRLGNTNRWLREIQIRDGIILLSDAAGNVITTSAPATATTIPTGTGAAQIMDTSIVEKTMRGQNGALQARHPMETTEAIIGYALATQPRLAVLVVQPASSAFAPTDYMLTRILWITIPLLVLTPLAAWKLMNYYHREQRLTRRLSEQNERLEQNARLKSEVLANVSHDLKTPIASMQLSLSGMLETHEGKEFVVIRDGLQLFHQELGQLSARVRNLLDMSRLEVNEVPTYREPCDLTDIVASALERLRMQVRDRPVIADFPPDPLLVECDQSQMETVILNLLENAVKYSPEGSPLYLTGALADDDMVWFSLRDQGPGIPLAHQDRIFGKFYRAGTRYAAGGTGLGLAICKAIVEAHGGRISLQTETLTGNNATGFPGAAFCISLPHASESVHP